MLPLPIADYEDYERYTGIWSDCTLRQLAKIQYELRDTDLSDISRKLKVEMFSKGEASDLITHILEGRLDVAGWIIKAKFSDHDCHASPEDGCEICERRLHE